jgi:hypothetical protein
MKATVITVAVDKPSMVQQVIVITRLIIALVLTAMLLFACSRAQDQSPVPSAAAAPVPATNEQMIERGAYMVTIMGCNDCHSPKIMTAEGPVPDTARLLSGHPAADKLPPVPANMPWMYFSPGLTAAVGPWGASFSANLTPDPLGLGGWSFDQFKTAITHGRYRGIEGGRPLLPPMPWQNLVNIHDEDARAIFAYLQSLKPVPNKVPAPIPPSDLVFAN